MEETMPQAEEQVDIELELPEGEVDIHAADVDDSIKEEVVAKTVEKKKDELDEVSASVQKRIDKLTRKMRESERREQAALEYAKKVQAENKQLNNRSTETNKAYVSDLTNRVTAQIDSAKNNLKNARIL